LDRLRTTDFGRTDVRRRTGNGSTQKGVRVAKLKKADGRTERMPRKARAEGNAGSLSRACTYVRVGSEEKKER